MFSLLGAGDLAGSGGDVILHGWKDENFRLPFIEETERPDKVELTLPLESVLSDKVKAELIKFFGDDVLSIDHTSLMILALAASEEVTNEKLQYTIDAHSSDISKMLKMLCKNGYLVAAGIGRGTHYKLNETYASTHASATPNAPVNAPVSSSPNRDKKVILNELIDFCRIWRKGAEMARHVGKTQKYIVRHLIPEMIGSGLLIRKYPDNPHHPAQRYRTKPKSGSNKNS